MKCKKEIILGIILIILESPFLFWFFRKIVKILKIMEKSTRKKIANVEIDEVQKELVPIVDRLFRDGKISFRSGFYHGANSRDTWELNDCVKGKYLFETFPEKFYQTMAMSYNIVNQYQEVVKEYLLTKKVLSEKDFIFNGQKWLFGKLLLWSGPIVEAGLMSHKEIINLANDFQKTIAVRGADFFGYAHGNIIGDHIFF